MNRSQQLVKRCEGLFDAPTILKDEFVAGQYHVFLKKSTQDLFLFGMYDSKRPEPWKFGSIGSGLPFNFSSSNSYEKLEYAEKGYKLLIAALNSGQTFAHNKALINKIAAAI